MNSIEPLEARIAPASIANLTLLNPSTALYHDADGDDVTVKFSKPVLVDGDLGAVFRFNVLAAQQQLQTLDLTAITDKTLLSGVSITFTAKVDHVAGGNGLADVGFINATGLDLGKVTVDGDLGRIVAGTNNATKAALARLTVDSLGARGVATQATTSPSLFSLVTGALGGLKVTHDVLGASVEATGPHSSIGAVVIGGNLIGLNAVNTGKIFSDRSLGNVTLGGGISGGGDYSGLIQAGTNMGRVKIGTVVLGGAGQYSGAIYSSGTIASVTIGERLNGYLGPHSGGIEAVGNIGPVSIGHFAHGVAASPFGMLGSSAASTGIIHSAGTLKSVSIIGAVKGIGKDSGQIWGEQGVGNVTIHGSLLGDTGDGSGYILSGASLGKVTITGEVKGGGGKHTGEIAAFGNIGGVHIGGALTGTDSVETGGILSGAGTIGTVFIGGSVAGGLAARSGFIAGDSIKGVTIVGSLTSGANAATALNGAIHAFHTLGHVTIKHDLIGTSGNPAAISAGEATAAAARNNIAIAGVTIGGKVLEARILAGYDDHLNATNVNASIGAIVVGRSWEASSIVAGVRDTSSFAGNPTPDGFGRNDTLISSPAAGQVARIASVLIKGPGIGSARAGTYFGITAESIGSVKISGTNFTPKSTNGFAVSLDAVHGNFWAVIAGDI